MTTVKTAPPVKAPGESRMRRTLSALGAAQAYIGLVLILAVGIATKGEMFLNETNLTNAIGAFASRGILAVGVTLVILTGGIDLSVGSLLGIASMTAAMMLAKFSLEPWQIVPVCMVVGALFGFLNGAGTAWLRIQSFVMTLAMLSVVRGLDRQVSDNVSVGTQIAGPDGKLTPQAEAFQLFGTPGHNLFDRIYYPVLAFIVVCVVFHLILTKTRFGRHVYAVGGNPTAARCPVSTSPRSRSPSSRCPACSPASPDRSTPPTAPRPTPRPGSRSSWTPSPPPSSAERRWRAARAPSPARSSGRSS